MSIGFFIDLVEMVKPIIYGKRTKFLGNIIIWEIKTVIKETQNNISDLALWFDRSKAKSGANAAIVWKKPHTDR